MRWLNAMVEAMSKAKESGLSETELNNVLTLVNWGDDDRAA
jgi:hypothetical protein